MVFSIIHIPTAPWSDESLGKWKKQALRDGMSSVVVDGKRVEEMSRLLPVPKSEAASTRFSSAGSAAEKAGPMKVEEEEEEEALVGDAKGLSGRLCSTLLQLCWKPISATLQVGSPSQDSPLSTESGFCDLTADC